jgi:predicted ABC-class ATPase
LRRIDGRGYKAYRDIQGGWDLDGLELHIDYVQGDPFAAPSKIRARIPMNRAGIPQGMQRSAARKIGLEDFLARQVQRAIRDVVSGRRGSGKSGVIEIDAGGQEILQRTAILLGQGWVEARMQVGLPAAGRRVLGREAAEMLLREIPAIVENSVIWRNLDQELGQLWVESAENYDAIRSRLEREKLVAFVADGSILPRISGAADRPLRESAVPFKAPDELKVTFELPNPLHVNDVEITSISGMGIPAGVTLIVGGGYHGKSTLLKALERGVYPHIPGDGREYVVTLPDAVKIRAEDGRRVEAVDISPFINDLPGGRSTTGFRTEEASGSTSQAANIVEAMEVGTGLLLLDEDTSATNFMVRDARMQELVSSENEPITPFLDRVKELFESHCVSTVLVMGGCGDYFDVADTVIMMREFLPQLVTDRAREIAGKHGTGRVREASGRMNGVTPRIPLAESFDPSRGRRDVKIDAKALDMILFGSDRIDLRQVEQLVDRSQTRAIGNAIHLLTTRWMDGKTTLAEAVDSMERFFDEEGLDALDPFRKGERHPGNFARPRRHEVAAAINRLRTVSIKQRKD